jgi:hypothetical protein
MPGRRVIITISDGVYHLDCFLSPKLFEMLDSEIISLYSVISINPVSSMTHMEDITLIILDALVVHSLDGVLGSPITYLNSHRSIVQLIQLVLARGRDVMIILKLSITFVSIMRR